MQSTTHRPLFCLPFTLLLVTISPTIFAQEWTLRDQLSPTGLIEDPTFGSYFGNSASALDGRYAIVGNRSDNRSKGAAYVFDVLSGEQTQRLTADRSRYFAGIGIDLSGDIAVIPEDLVNDGSSSFHLFNIDSGEQIREYRPRDFGVRRFWIHYKLDEEMLAFNSGYATPPHPLHFVDLATGDEFLRLPHADHFDLDDGRAIVSDASQNKAIVMDIESQEELLELKPSVGELPCSGCGGKSVALSGSYALLRSVWDNGSYFDVFDSVTGELLTTIDVGSNDWAVDGDYAVFAFGERVSQFPRLDRWSASIFDIRTGREVFSFPWHEGDGISGSVDIDDNTAIFAVPTEDEAGGILYVATLTGLQGDFDSNGFFDATDINLLSEQVRLGTGIADFDLNSDGAVDDLDRVFWVDEIAQTTLGDANLDNQVDFGDFLTLSASFGQPGGWENGDFDGSGDVAFGDFLLLSENFGQSDIAAASVPEPNSMALTLIAVAAAITLRRRRRC